MTTKKDNIHYITKFKPTPTPSRTITGSRYGTVYHTYNFIEKDPVIDILRTAMQKQELPMKEIAVRSGVSRETLKQWFGGKTRRPQFASCQAVARALGLSFELVQKSGWK